MAAGAVAPKLVLGIGNPSRGDDAIGPIVVERIEALGLAGVETLTDFQLQIEHALDLMGREEVVFVDAAASGAAPFALTPLAAAADGSITTHALSPAAVLDAYRRFTDRPPPAARVLAVRGYAFELGAPLDPRAAAHIEAAVRALAAHLASAPRVR